MTDTLQSGFGIGDWVVYPQENRLKGPNRECVLEPKVMDVLVLLAGRQGDVVSRQQILDSVWAGVVVGDEVISRAVSLLRTQLGDDQKNPRYLKTISKRGYCLIADVIVVSSNEPQQIESASNASASATRRTMRKLSFTIVTVLALALAYFAYDIFLLRPESDDNAGNIGKSIAVLPFVNMSADSDNEYFSDGLSEELLNRLTKIPELRVAARTSSFSFKGKDVKISQIGRELSVTHVLEGSVRKSGNQIRITAQLVKTADGFQLWSETFDRNLDDIFVVQDEIAAAVVRGLKVTLLGELPEQRLTDPDVYTLYLQGNYFNRLGGEENAQRALQALKQALAIDPEYAPAWSSLQFTYGTLIGHESLPRDEGIALSMQAVNKALEIDDQLVPAWAGLAWIKRSYFWDWQGARAAVEKALQLDPNNANAIGVAASIASTFGELDKAIELFERNVESDPLRWSSLYALGNRYRTVGRLEEARTAYERVVALNPEYRGVRFQIVGLYLNEGRPEEALAKLTGLPDGARFRQIKAFALFDMGETQKAQMALDDFLQSPSPPGPASAAIMYAWRGENDEAFESLEMALEQRDIGLISILWNPVLARLKDDPRYPILLEKIGLREAWEAMPSEYGGPSK